MRVLSENTDSVEHEYIFKPLTRNGKLVFKEGKNGTGKTLRFICGFCRDLGSIRLVNGQRIAMPTHAFRSQRERNRHAHFCKGPIDSRKQRYQNNF